MSTWSRILDVPRAQVYGIVREGRLTHARVGKRIRIPDSAVRALVGQAEDQTAA